MADNGQGTGMEDLSSLLEDDEQENGFDEDIRITAPAGAEDARHGQEHNRKQADGSIPGRQARMPEPADNTSQGTPPRARRQADASTGTAPGADTAGSQNNTADASASAHAPTMPTPSSPQAWRQQPRQPYRMPHTRTAGPAPANRQGTAPASTSTPASAHASTNTNMNTPIHVPAGGSGRHAGSHAGQSQSRQPPSPSPASGQADASSPASGGGRSGFMPARAQGQAPATARDSMFRDGRTHAGHAQRPATAYPASTSASASTHAHASASAPMREHDRTLSHGQDDGRGALADMDMGMGADPGLDENASVDEDMAEAVSQAALKPDASRPSPSPSSSSSSGSLSSRGRRPHGRLPHVPALKPYGSGHADAGGGADPVNMPHAGTGGVLKHSSASKPASSRRMHRPGDVYAKDETPESMTGPEAARARHGRVTPRRYRMRGPDRTKRVRRDHIGAVALSDPQERIIDRVNREYAKGKAFVPTDTDRRIWDYLALFRFATRSDVVRVGGWHGGYARQAPRIVRYGDLGLIIAERVPLSTLDYIQLTHEGMVMSSYAFLPDPSPTEATRGDRSHSLGLSSLASQLLTPSREYDQPGHDLLGVGDGEWAAIRREIRQGEAKVVGETIYRSAWSRMRSDAHARGRSQSAVTDPRVASLMNRIFREWKGKGGAQGDTLEWVCADPESQGEFAWLWMIYGGEAVRGGERDAQGRPRHIPPSERATDERGKIIAQPGDDIITRDHPPDMVIARHRQPGTGRPRSLAIELELTGKSVADYKATMSSYMSGNGKILYDKVIWLVVQASVANLIRTGAKWAGAVEGRDYIIAPVSNEANRSKDEFYDGLDMRPGSFKLTSSGNAYGYAIISSLMNEMDREKEARQ